MNQRNTMQYGQHLDPEELADYHESRLSAHDMERAGRHLRACTSCSADLQAHGAMLSMLAALPQYQVPRSFRLDEVQARRRRASLWPAYASLAASVLLALVTVFGLLGASGGPSASQQAALTESDQGTTAGSSSATGQMDDAVATAASGVSVSMRAPTSTALFPPGVVSRAASAPSTITSGGGAAGGSRTRAAVGAATQVTAAPDGREYDIGSRSEARQAGGYKWWSLVTGFLSLALLAASVYLYSARRTR